MPVSWRTGFLDCDIFTPIHAMEILLFQFVRYLPAINADGVRHGLHGNFYFSKLNKGDV